MVDGCRSEDIQSGRERYTHTHKHEAGRAVQIVMEWVDEEGRFCVVRIRLTRESNLSKSVPLWVGATENGESSSRGVAFLPPSLPPYLLRRCALALYLSHRMPALHLLLLELILLVAGWRDLQDGRVDRRTGSGSARECAIGVGEQVPRVCLCVRAFVCA